MQHLKIIASEKGEAAAICAACRFIPIQEPQRLSVIAPVSEWPAEPTSFPELDSPEEDRDWDNAGTITIFASLASFRNSPSHSSPTLCIYKNMYVMEMHASSRIPAELKQQGYNLAIVHGDRVIDYLDPDITLIKYQNVTDYYKDTTGKIVLLTANQQLLLTLLSIDSLNWTVIHPELAALNLILDVCADPQQRVLRDLQLILKHIDTLNFYDKSLPDLEAISALRSNDKTSYSFFANNYDQYMAHVDYDLWVSRVLRWAKAHSSRPLQKILELACGTANVSSRLVSQGYQVDASDLSANMLSVAAQKPFKPQLYQASLIDPIPGTAYDLIICMFDSINYLLSVAELSTLFANTAKALATEGIFIFDISTRLNSEENFDDICSLTRSEDGMLVHRAWFESLQMQQKSSLRYFHKEIVGYSQQHELHVQRVYLCSEIISVISASKLTLKAIYSIDSDRNLYPRHVQAADDRYYRLFFILKKEQ